MFLFDINFIWKDCTLSLYYIEVQKSLAFSLSSYLPKIFVNCVVRVIQGKCLEFEYLQFFPRPFFMVIPMICMSLFFIFKVC